MKSHLLIPYIINSVSIGVLLVGVIVFLYIFRFSRTRLHLATAMGGFVGILFIAGEIGVMFCYLTENQQLGRQMHRLQALAAGGFIFAIPCLIFHLLELKDGWRKINKALVNISIGFLLALVIAAFAAPEYFVSQTKVLSQTSGLRWNIARGKTGLIYNIRDIVLSLLMLYMLICLIVERVWYGKFNYIMFPLVGLVIAILSAYFDFLVIHRNIRVWLFPFNYVSFSSLGITIFVVLSMFGVIRKFLDQSRNIEKAMKIESLGIFAGGIAHDFNNLLTAILGNLSLVKLTLNQGDRNFVMLGEAEKASLRARELTQQLLTFSKGGAPIKKLASIKDILYETAGFVLRGSKVKSEFRFSPELKNVSIDHGQISQVIQNLILNAMQAMPQGGVVSISAENSDLVHNDRISIKSGDFVKITIRDHGCGIAKKDLDRIFDPYFSTKECGHGLGLTLSYSIVKHHDGFMYAESGQGEGTSFIVFLPASEESLERSEETQSADMKAPGRILIMDDEEMIRSLLERMVIELGFDVAVADEGRRAVELYKESFEKGRPFNCVILDLTVPGGMGGRETLEQLLKIDSSVKAIISSGYSHDAVMANYSEYGFAGYITKPFQFEDLKKLLFEILA